MTNDESAASGSDEGVRQPVAVTRRPYDTPLLVECGPVAKLLIDTAGEPKGVGELVEQAFQ